MNTTDPNVDFAMKKFKGSLFDIPKKETFTTQRKKPSQRDYISLKSESDLIYATISKRINFPFLNLKNLF